MSRMSELAWALEEYEPDRDLEMAAFHQYELEYQQQLEQQARKYPVVITPEAFTDGSRTRSAQSVPPVLSMQWLPPPPRAR